MPSILIPAGNIISPAQPFNRSALEDLLLELCDSARDFTGFISVISTDVIHLLFIFRGQPYAAGKSVGEKPFALSIAGFCSELSTLADPDATISVHATDPVLLKCLLIFIQDELTAKAPISLINLDAVLGQIQAEASDALILLEKTGMFNFFFFKDGVKGKCYYADPAAVADEGTSIDEQMLLYAYQGGDIDVMIYRTIATKESTDAEQTSRDEMLRLLRGDTGNLTVGETVVTPEVAEVEIVEDDLLLTVLEGPCKGETLSGNIPCVIGRKDTDLVVTDPMISKTHAAFQVVNGKLLLVDLNSTNGTTVNGQAIKQHEIAENDIIAIGGSQLRVTRIRKP